MNDLVLEHREHGLLTLTMNKPERRNALSADLLDALLVATERAASDPDVRALLLRGAGGTFSVGGDVQSMADPNAWAGSLEYLTDTLRARTRISELLHEMPKPTVALIEKAAAGAGLSLALACDFRIAGVQAKLTTAFVKVALSGDFGGAYFLTKLLGSAKARELYLTSPVLSGDEALRMGLVTKAPADADVEAVARAFALELASGPTVTVGYIKKNINAAETLSLREVLGLESLHHSRCMGTDDHREAANAFLEKRAPSFKAR